MPRTWHYSRGRRLLMQGVMWVILAATLGLTTLIKPAADAASLGPPIQMRSITVRLPVKWSVRVDPQGPNGVLAREPAKGHSSFVAQRVLRVQEFDADDADAVALLAAVVHAKPETIRAVAQPFAIGGADGIVVQQDAEVGNGYEATEVVAAAVLPGARGVVLRLITGDRWKPADEALLRAVAQSIEPRFPGGPTTRPE